MDRALVERSEFKLPAALAPLFNDPPLVGDEKRQDYDNFFSAIVAAVNPGDAIVWLLARDFADLSWEIRRERSLKLQVIKSAETHAVGKLLGGTLSNLPNYFTTHPEGRKIAKQASQWTSDPKTRLLIDKKLADQGYTASHIFTAALNQVADHIDAIDGRIASYELRRMTVLRAIEQYSEKLARRLTDSADVIEGQFTEATEEVTE